MKLSGFSKVLVILAGMFSVSANATLIGETISTDLSVASPGTATIGAGAEFTLNDGIGFFDYVSVDFDASSVSFTNIAGFDVNYFGFGPFSFSGFDIEITGLSIFSNDGVAGGLANNFSFDADNLFFDLTETSFDNGADIVFTIETLDDQQNPIPEPTSIALLMFGLLAISRKAFR